MITFFVNTAGEFGIRDYLANRGRELDGHVNVLLYEELGEVTTLPATGTIFAGLDQTGPTTLAAAATLHDALSAVHPPLSILNHPLRSLQRYALLRRLHEIGCNRFNAIRATDDPGVLRYPVFVRYESRHNGSMSPLLHDRHALDRALIDLAARGISAQKLLVVEFCDTSGPDGLFRKYSAMRIGDTIIPRHFHAGPSWIAKSRSNAGNVDEALVREELDYLHNAPHARWLRDVFDEARIEYGRIDYGVYKGEPQAWEINTNPTLGRGRKPRTAAERVIALREPARAASHRRMFEALQRLQRLEPSEPLEVICSPSVVARVKAEAQAQRRDLATRRIRRAVLKSAVSQYVKRAVRPLLARIAPALARVVRHTRAGGSTTQIG